jgi:hypothetical protein
VAVSCGFTAHPPYVRGLDGERQALVLEDLACGQRGGGLQPGLARVPGRLVLLAEQAHARVHGRIARGLAQRAARGLGGEQVGLS